MKITKKYDEPTNAIFFLNQEEKNQNSVFVNTRMYGYFHVPISSFKEGLQPSAKNKLKSNK